MVSQITKKSTHKTEINGRLSWFEIQIKNPWFFIIVWSLGIPTFAFSIYVLFHIYFLQKISSDGQTDYPVLIAAILTALIAAFTLLVTWYIKDEAEGIGDKVITSTVIHRHLDRMLHEYSLIVLELYEKSRAEKEPDFYFKLDFPLKSTEWFVNNHQKELNDGFFVSLMPGVSGQKFSEMVSFDSLLKILSEEIATEEDRLEFIENKKSILSMNKIYFKEVDLLKTLCNRPTFDPEESNDYEIIANYDKKLDNEYPHFDDYSEPEAQDDYESDTQEAVVAQAARLFKEECKEYDKLDMAWKKSVKNLKLDITNLENGLGNHLSTNDDVWITIPKTAEEVVHFGDRLKMAKEYYLKEIKETEEEINITDDDRETSESILEIYNKKLENNLENYERYIKLIEEYLEGQSKICRLQSEIKARSDKIVISGSAIHNIMIGLGWLLPFEYRKIEEKVEEIYGGLDETSPSTPQPVQ